jgi:hypothetical protein
MMIINHQRVTLVFVVKWTLERAIRVRSTFRLTQIMLHDLAAVRVQFDHLYINHGSSFLDFRQSCWREQRAFKVGERIDVLPTSDKSQFHTGLLALRKCDTLEEISSIFSLKMLDCDPINGDNRLGISRQGEIFFTLPRNFYYLAPFRFLRFTRIPNLQTLSTPITRWSGCSFVPSPKRWY